MLSSHLARQPVNVIIQKGVESINQNEKVQDADLFVTKLGIEDYDFTADTLNEGP